ncbi:helix-turn-helix transcriptional regulator [Algoriphagus sp. D3-2-R+10]|uniref:helix-turn-helix domain-containing protein n=1 Tax=Algoriphagus aurantiacus TaxID=3103948 RepID=UPI002B3A2632|nr:helix-turn-helix transcriptional regulator [Algoriphagus sp. D3-2-R+10]MEB2774566.1 helix-turn-helix transcriptional regulator [Algoriphagus sp. D3-2-R+10]
MTENQRLKFVRKFLNKTQVEFASSIGLTQAGYSDIERGKNNVSGKIKILLKREHHVNMSWLESGEGEMFLPINEIQSQSDHTLIANLKLEIDKLQKEINHLSSEKKQYLETIKNLETQLKRN